MTPTTTAEELAREFASRWARASSLEAYDQCARELLALLTTFSERVRGEAIEAAAIAVNALQVDDNRPSNAEWCVAISLAEDAIRALSPTTETTRTDNG